jgi:hypothetical protein
MKLKNVAACDDADTDLVPDAQVRKELGNMSEMQAWRYDNYLKRGLPSKAPPGWELPARIGSRKFRTRGMIKNVTSHALRRALEPHS